jgi:hypothetical protein
LTVTIFFEGGGARRDLRTRCRRGFRSFFEKAGFAGRMPRVVPAGSREDAFSNFQTALRNSSERNFVVLLVDSESPHDIGVSRWRHVRQQDGWPQPDDSTEDHVHFMAQCMEAWFLADPDAIERIPKRDVLDGLDRATSQCPNGPYRKGTHSFEILGRIDPQRVAETAPCAASLMTTLSRVTAS